MMKPSLIFLKYFFVSTNVHLKYAALSKLISVVPACVKIVVLDIWLHFVRAY
jgi:hypothetical protein